MGRQPIIGSNTDPKICYFFMGLPSIWINLKVRCFGSDAAFNLQSHHQPQLSHSCRRVVAENGNTHVKYHKIDTASVQHEYILWLMFEIPQNFLSLVWTEWFILHICWYQESRNRQTAPLLGFKETKRTFQFLLILAPLWTKVVRSVVKIVVGMSFSFGSEWRDEVMY